MLQNAEFKELGLSSTSAGDVFCSPEQLYSEAQATITYSGT